jgi:serine/threonine protein kinase
MLRVLGKGAYGEVLLVRHKQTRQLYALKTIEKATIERHVPMQAVLREINI